MARGKSHGMLGVAQPGIASQSRFAALQMDVGGDDSSDDDDARLPVPATASTASPSKKALQRKRQKLRKKASNLQLNGAGGGGTDSDVSAVSPNQDPPVPPVSAPLQASTNGSEEEEEEHRHTVVEKPEEEKSFADAVKEDRDNQPEGTKVAMRGVPPAVPASVTTDGESADEYGGQEDDDDSSSDEEEEAESQQQQQQQQPSTSSQPVAAVKEAVKSVLPASSSPRQQPSSSSAAQQSQQPTTQAYTGADHDPNKKLKAVLQRTVWGVVMAAGAIGLVCMGHVYVIALVFIIQAVVFKELTALFDAGYAHPPHSAAGAAGADGETTKVSTRTPEREAKRKGRKEERERWSRKMAWYFFAVTNYYLYGESLIYYFKHILTLQASFLPTAYTFAQHHRLISFGLYTIGFVSFVATLNRASLRRQFSLFGWIHMSLLLIVVSSHFIVNNILEGMIWFWVPISLVIVNDVAAYVCGMLFGRHQLIKLSPKKTVEGFVGALIVTMIFAYFWGTFFMRFNYMICPVQDLSTSVFSNIKCQPNHVFEWHRLPIPASVTALLEQITRKHITAIPYAPFQLHSIVLAAFASLVAPFGGFFASGFKRAAGIKDFGNSLPGHGGFLDRMDCQFLMGLFTFVYHSSLVREIHASPSQILSAFATLTTEQQVQVLEMLKHVVDHKSVRA
ncbi:hypothetical protein JCM8115_000876 [Rhodotorula mucilaginosa]